ncbi:MAG TPA: sigma-54 dependent transcriptional regulator [Kofleriaceae bacterium]|nr:sigma-54 dependent transcriptional regulator [Kofleriaceae bacterium]
MSRILIVEDEELIRAELRRLLLRAGYEVAEAESVLAVERDHDLRRVDLVITDLRLPGPPGTELITRASPVPVIVMTSYATVKSAVAAMQQGAADYLAKPFDPDELLLVIARVLDQARLRRQVAALRADVERAFPVTGMIGSSAAMREVAARIAKVAPTDATVLVRGESGTGKELVARAIHAGGPRRDGPFVAVNCASIPDGLIESELFGHERGAFTGAATAAVGLVEAAAGGTLFLDEIGELPLPAQARLLRFLQESEVRRVGATRSRHVDVRVVAATHRELARMVADKTFREDLYYRLRVVEIVLPPLRERGDDVQELAHQLLLRTAARLGHSGLAFTAESEAAISAHHWPGNVRELDNAIERAAILCDTGWITPELLALDAPGASLPGAAALPASDSLEDYFRQFVREHEQTLSETELARRLGISRKALWERRQRLGMPRAPRKP